ncbi:VOC family protein (plasmid) [Haladaptatus sp. SPP-AMP-3]|uniref:VOC family protein n=1 Tax=Haladaptatus sp. SPP-AMP-3 TaxID=3121295 RepID=UPI003C2C6324
MDLLDGVYETHVGVADLDRAMDFYGDMLGLELGRHDPGRKIVFYFTGTPRSMLGVWEKEDPKSSHFAFRVSEDEVDEMLPFLEDRDIEPRAAFGVEPENQSSTRGCRARRSTSRTPTATRWNCWRTCPTTPTRTATRCR